MDFSASSHRQRWMYSVEELSAERQRTREAVLQKTAKTTSQPITLIEEVKLLYHYQQKLVAVCCNLKLPHKVLSTAVIFLKRFYLKQSSLNYDPQQMTLVSLYLACKVEDCYISAAELGRLVGAPAEALLKWELVLLEGLQFDLQVHSLYRALDGFLNDDTDLTLDRSIAFEACNDTLLSDAALLFTPGQLALAALCSRIEENDMKEKLLDKIVGMKGDGNKKELWDMVVEINGIVAESKSGQSTGEEVAAIDRRLKAYIKATSGGGKKTKKGKNDVG